MSKKTLKPGTILSESSFFVVKDVQPGKVIVINEDGKDITIGTSYVDQILSSADHYESEEKKTATELSEIFVASARVAMTVCFIKKDTEKTKTAYNAEKKAKIAEISSAPVSKIEGLLNDLIENPITRTIPGGERTMKGRHYGHVDEFGRVHFIDMEIKRDLSKPDHDSRKREVDTRTIQWLIVNGVKYVRK